MPSGQVHPQPLLPRSHLLSRIQAALRYAHVFVIAPAGYGKSSLLRSLVAHQPDSYYVPLSPGDADLAVLQSRLAHLPAEAKLIALDDLHWLGEGGQSLDWLAERLAQPSPRWVLSGRSLPPALFPPGDDGPALLLQQEDLAFQPAESQALLSSVEGVVAGEWHAATGGWPLALALLARQSAQTVNARSPALNQQAIFAWLAHAIFAALPDRLREFVHLSALPLRFNDELLAQVLALPLDQVTALRREIQARSLFLEESGGAGWYAYHQVVRQYLCSQVNEETRQGVAVRLVAHFEAAGDLRMAVEHAVEAALHADAARLMATHGGHMLLDLGWLHSYQRWLSALPPAVQAQHPLVLAQLGFALVYQRQQIEEGLAHLERAQRLADGLDGLTAHEVTLRRATAYHLSGQPGQALPLLQTALAYTGFPLRSQIRGRLYLAAVYARLQRLRDARRVYAEMEPLIAQLPEEADRRFFADIVRHNRGSGIEAVRGDFGRFAQTLGLSLAADAGQPAALEMDLVGCCILHENRGEWEALAEDLAQIRDVRLQQMTPTEQAGDYRLTPRWELFYWACLHMGRGEWAAASPFIDRFVAAVSDPEAVACGEWLRAWHLRGQGSYSECASFVKSLPPQPDEAARFYRAATAWEGAASAFLSGQADWLGEREDALGFHMQIGARHYLLRWRLLMALDGHGRGAAAWRKHVRFVLAQLARDGYDRLLIQREPIVAAHFWTLCAEEGIQPQTALAALKELGHLPPITARLRAQPQSAELLAALVATGKEEAIPFVDELLAGETSPPVRSRLQRALNQLEAQPPPTLHVTLLGPFNLRRGDQPLAADAWSRPSARHLFQYFCLHRGQRLSRARILQDLWPESDAQSGLTAFRTAFSRLGATLEPYLRKRTPMRYFRVSDEVYTFDPQGDRVIIDSEGFSATVRAALAQSAPLDEGQLAGLLAALSAWQTPLADVAYADWAIHAVESLTERFAAGCHLAGERLLALDRAVEATLWTERGVSAAPWHEGCWQILIRATASQGLRSLALQRYARAVAALEAELGAPPSPQTQQLAERLRRNEAI